MYRLIVTVLIIAFFAGCSYKGSYNGLRMSQQSNCGKYEGIQREKCLADADMSYQEYKRAN